MRRVNLLLSFEVYLSDEDPIPSAAEEVSFGIWHTLGILADTTTLELIDRCCIHSVEIVCDGCYGRLPYHLVGCPNRLNLTPRS